jgi:hypothetical protein
MIEDLTLDPREQLLFAAEDPQRKNEISIDRKWKILIVDDDPEVHKITKLVLQDFIFEGKPLEFISAYSGEEAKKSLPIIRILR